MSIILGGNIQINGSENAFFKELVMRVENFNEAVYDEEEGVGRPSCANDNPSYPTQTDRAVFRTIRINQYNRASLSDERIQSYSLHYLQNSFNE